MKRIIIMICLLLAMNKDAEAQALDDLNIYNLSTCCVDVEVYGLVACGRTPLGTVSIPPGGYVSYNKVGTYDDFELNLALPYMGLVLDPIYADGSCTPFTTAATNMGPFGCNCNRDITIESTGAMVGSPWTVFIF